MTNHSQFTSRAKGALLGLALGDALGTTLEFKAKDSFEPITDMVGGGPFNLAAGQWTDDTSMALCLADSLLEHFGHNAQDQMERYVQWRNEGYNSVTGHCFDIGNTVSAALDKFEATGEPYAGSYAEHTAGNGSLMRLAPVVMFYMNHHTNSREKVNKFAQLSSKTTHSEARCLKACEVLSNLLYDILLGERDKKTLVENLMSYQV